MASNTIVIIVTVVIVVVIIIATMVYNYVQDNMKTGGTKINEFLTRHCSDKAVMDTKDYEWVKEFEKHHATIKKEFLEYSEKYVVPSYADISAGSSGGNRDWKAVFLRVFNNDTTIISSFPKTKELIDNCPQRCTSGYFSMLEPRSKILPHVGIYKGVIRLHLGVVIPKDRENVFIVVDGQKLHWTEGKVILFDDMYIHHVENNTDEKRVVLFLDIQRDFKSVIVNMINNFMIRMIKTNDELLKTLDKANKLTKIKL